MLGAAARGALWKQKATSANSQNGRWNVQMKDAATVRREEMREHGGHTRRHRYAAPSAEGVWREKVFYYTSRKAAGLPARLRRNFTSVCEKIFLYSDTKVQIYISPTEGKIGISIF